MTPARLQSTGRRGRRAARLLAFAALLPGCVGVRGSGNADSEARFVPPFKAIEASGVVKVNATAGEPLGVTVNGDDNLVPLVVTEVQDGRLRIGTDQAVRPQLDLVVDVSAREIDAASASGSAHITLRNIKDGTLELDVGGAANITASGRARHVDMHLSGAATADTKTLKAAAVHVTASGSGTAEVFASKLLQVHLSGAGDVRYHGNPPKVVKRISGGGTIEKR